MISTEGDPENLEIERFLHFSFEIPKPPIALGVLYQYARPIGYFGIFE